MLNPFARAAKDTYNNKEQKYYPRLVFYLGEGALYINFTITAPGFLRFL